MQKRVAFVTIGQSPRSDLVPQMLAEMQSRVEVTEYGVVDGMSVAEIAAIAPRPGEQHLVSRLRDGSQVLLGKPAIEKRLTAILAGLDESGLDLIVLLCTGRFGHFRLKTPFIEPQHIVDHFVQGLAYEVERLGVMLPDAKQIDQFHSIPGLETKFSAASPYAKDCDAQLRAAAEHLADTGMIVMHCMGYSEDMRREVRARTGRPVLLARRLVGQAIDLMIS
ncbi:MAG: AroM family protein [Hyphomicrobiales bacterium]